MAEKAEVTISWDGKYIDIIMPDEHNHFHRLSEETATQLASDLQLYLKAMGIKRQRRIERDRDG